jgi:prevent-host-death family protein
MTRVELREAKATLATYVRRARRSPVVITEEGKVPVVVRPISPEEWEDLAVGTHPGFMALIRRSRAQTKPGQGIPLADIEREFLKKPARQAASSPKRRSK